MNFRKSSAFVLFTNFSMPSRTPTLETERLRLREQGLADLDAAAEFWSRPDVYRHIDGKPRAREEVWRRTLSNAGTWALFGYGSWWVETRDGRFAGLFGFLQAEREMTPAFAPGEIEVGWSLAPEAQGKGYAFEALSAIFGWADEALPDRTFVCIISPENAPSLKLAAKVGFHKRGMASYQGKDVIQFERTRPA